MQKEWKEVKSVRVGSEALRAHGKHNRWCIYRKDGSCDGDLWVGHINKMFRHDGPGSGHSDNHFIIIAATWYTAYDFGNGFGMYCPLSKLPCIRTDAGVNKWEPLKCIACVSNIMVLPHHEKEHVSVVVHKHIDFLEAAGYATPVLFSTEKSDARIIVQERERLMRRVRVRAREEEEEGE